MKRHMFGVLWCCVVLDSFTWFCISVHGAESAMNRMQAGWARALLGCRHTHAGAWPLLVAELGWKRRLGTRMLERAIMLRARALLLQESHPARRVLTVARASSHVTWHTAVLERGSARSYSHCRT